MAVLAGESGAEENAMMKSTWTIFILLAVVRSGLAADRDQIGNAAEFDRIVPAAAGVQKLAGGMKFLEGPVWVPSEGGFLIFSDIPADEMKRWNSEQGLAVFRKPSQKVNGNTLDRQGRLVSCEEGGRRVILTEKDGTVRVLVDQFEGKKLNSPNDVVVKSDGTVWFTDPTYGIKPELKEQSGNYVYRYDPKARKLTVAVKDCDMPNGLCFSPDEKRLYVADSGKPHHIRVFSVQRGGTLKGGEVFCVIRPGGPDGIRCDQTGRLYSTAGDGVHVFASNGSFLGKILVPETPANLCFGGKDGRMLFITARTSLYAIPLSVTGAR
jgi:gluconolactonase